MPWIGEENKELWHKINIIEIKVSELGTTNEVQGTYHIWGRKTRALCSKKIFLVPNGKD